MFSFNDRRMQQDATYVNILQSFSQALRPPCHVDVRQQQSPDWRLPVPPPEGERRRTTVIRPKKKKHIRGTVLILMNCDESIRSKQINDQFNESDLKSLKLRISCAFRSSYLYLRVVASLAQRDPAKISIDLMILMSRLTGDALIL